MPLNSAAELRLRAVIAELAALRRHIEILEHEVIHLSWKAGATWDQIGEAHSPPIARQTAQKRYAHPKPRRRPKEKG